MATRLTHVVEIIDIDGFMINNTFHCKESGWLKVGEAFLILVSAGVI